MQKRCEEMTGPSAASLITCVSPDSRGAGEEAAGSHTLPLRRHDVNTGPLQSPRSICLSTCKKNNNNNPVYIYV